MMEPYIVVIDGVDNPEFELVCWFESLDEARDFYDNLVGLYPDDLGRHKRIYQEIDSSEQSINKESKK